MVQTSAIRDQALEKIQQNDKAFTDLESRVAGLASDKDTKIILGKKSSLSVRVGDAFMLIRLDGTFFGRDTTDQERFGKRDPDLSVPLPSVCALLEHMGGINLTNVRKLDQAIDDAFNRAWKDLLKNG